MSKSNLTFVVLSIAFLCLAAWTRLCFSEPVSMDEAVRIADYWYTQEVNSRHNRIPVKERKERLDRIFEHKVYYLSDNKLLEGPPYDQDIAAYVVIYKPKGFVIVSGEDSLQPILVHSVKSTFRWDNPEQNYLRYFLTEDVSKCVKRQRLELRKGKVFPINQGWQYFRKRIKDAVEQETPTDSGSLPPTEDAPEDDSPFDVWFIFETPTWDQGQYYNSVVAENNGGNTNIPTGCTATAMAIKMRYHKWPMTGNSSHSYDDIWGDIKFHHSANFAGHTYNWSAMPMSSLSSENKEVATLMYHCGVAVEMDYEEGGSGAWPSASAMNTYFRYHDTVEESIDHTNKVRDSLRSGLPVVISTTTHTMVADGYYHHTLTDTDRFHINCGWNGNNDGWYSLGSLPVNSDPSIDRSYPYSTPGNYVYVNGQDNIFNDGTIHYPYRYIESGVSNTPTNGYLFIKSGTYTGTYNAPITFDKAMTIRSYYGSATIGSY